MIFTYPFPRCASANVIHSRLMVAHRIEEKAIVFFRKRLLGGSRAMRAFRKAAKTTTEAA
jgi:hypothetical protein